MTDAVEIIRALAEQLTLTDIIQIVVMFAVVGSLIFTGITFIRLRKSEQVKLVEGILRDVRSLTKEFNLMHAEDPQDPREIEVLDTKLDRLVDHTFGILNWYAFLIKTKEIHDKKLVKYYRPQIIHWYDTMFTKRLPQFVDDKTAFPYIKELYKKYKNELEQESSSDK